MGFNKRRTTQFLLGLLITCCYFPLQAQFLLKENEQRFKSNSPSISIIKRTSDGGFITGGSEQPEAKNLAKFEPSQLDFLIIKRDSKGAITWQQRYGGPLFEDLGEILLLDDGGYLLCGNLSNREYEPFNIYDKQKPGPGSLEYYVVRIDEKGKVLWEKVFGTQEDDIFRGAIKLPDGGYLLGSNTLELKDEYKNDRFYSGNVANDSWSTYHIFRLDSEGNVLWDHRYTGNEGASLMDIERLPDGGFFLLGWGNSGIGMDRTIPKSSSSDFWLVKIDSIGNKVWDKAYPGYLAEEITRLADGNYLLSGILNIIKIDPDGNLLWQKNYSEKGMYKERIFTILPLKDSSFILGGSSLSEKSYNVSVPQKKKNEDYDFFVIKADKSGNKLWSQTLEGSGTEAVRLLEEVKENVYLLGGATNSANGYDLSLPAKGSNDLWLLTVKENPDPAIFAEAQARTICVGNGFVIPFKINQPFNKENIFTAQLSDSSGSFINALEIGKLKSTLADSLRVTLPANIPAGRNYQVRVTATEPAVIGTGNQARIEIINYILNAEIVSFGPGHMVFKPNGGLGPYQFTIDDKKYFEINSDQKLNFNNLDIGRHVISTKDKAGCKTNLPINILPLKHCGEEVNGQNSQYFFILNQLPNKVGSISILYNFFDKPIMLEAYVGGTLVASTKEPVNNEGVLQFPFNPANGEDKCYIKITSKVTDAKWQYKIICP